MPEKTRVGFLNGEVWLDLSKEQFFSHNQVKNEYAFVLTGLAKTVRRGRFVPDGMLLTNEEAELACQPAGAFFSMESLASEKVRLVEGRDDGFVELVGSPDMVLEVVSDSSEEKDTVDLMELYWRANIQEYRLVDARGPKLRFDIYRHTAQGHVSVRKQGGWVKSAVFGKAFRLTQTIDEQGHPEYKLEVR